ncbi:hypothetical protein [Streptomyces sp. NPDC006285]|uniref:hypothetical protein n=1 Tax=Streptomyces sp. NPDC006285 TaxID=3364742 RepID=UPI00367F8CE5
MTADIEDQDAEQQLPEDFPDGTFGHARPASRLPEHFTPCTPDEQARHVEALLAGIADFAVGPAIEDHLERLKGQS